MSADHDAGPTPIEVAEAVIDAFAANDLERMRELLADDLRAYVTTDDGGVEERTADEYVAGVEWMDVPSANLRLDVTQMVETEPGRVLVMVEVHAARTGRTLHNHAAHLLSVTDGRVSEWWMVEALPAESAGFWAA